MTIKDINPPTAEPIDLPYAKTFLRVDHDEDDVLITDLIQSARERIERLIRGTLITRRRLYTSRHARSGIFVNHSPVTTVHRVGVVGDDGSVVDVPLGALAINLRSIPAAIRPAIGTSWQDYQDTPCAVEAELDAGYGASKGEIPAPLRHAILLLIAQGYESRAASETPPIPMMVDALIMPYRGLRL